MKITNSKLSSKLRIKSRNSSISSKKYPLTNNNSKIQNKKLNSAVGTQFNNFLTQKRNTPIVILSTQSTLTNHINLVTLPS